MEGARWSAPRRASFLALLSAYATAWAAAAEPQGAVPPSPIPAEQARLADHSLLIAIAAAGERLVAVGDRGVVVLSDDRGAGWRQATSVPAQALLTGVCFFDARRGVAVGHDEVVLVTGDGGDRWQIAHYAPAPQRPLLDVWCGAGGAAIAVGAYSTYLVSNDGGATWNEQPFRPSPAARGAGTPRDTRASSGIEGTGGGYHLNRIVGASASRLYIAGEAGHLYRSEDGGASWQELASPYAGSFFDVLPLAGDALLASGLRGNLYRSEDGGHSWRHLETGTVALLDGGALLPGGGVAVVGLSGVVLVSRDAGESFSLEQQGERTGLSAALAVGTGALVVVGEGGARLLTLGGGSTAGAGAGR